MQISANLLDCGTLNYLTLEKIPVGIRNLPSEQDTDRFSEAVHGNRLDPWANFPGDICGTLAMEIILSWSRISQAKRTEELRSINFV
ncbi:hypothetical protein QE152_g36037 [Popillia japonica]|uniref:Uncharacterized protein n=1 Tax=Popillia japonica TaxID=7064 RepID=A0AAW1IEG7_POPJA